MMAGIDENIARVHEIIATSAGKANRSPDEITLVAVSKTIPVEAIEAAIAAGVHHFGENRVEEVEGKIKSLQTGNRPTWHMIGHIQSRKAKSILQLFDVVHSVERLKIAQKLSEQARIAQKTLPIFLEINISGEESKDGFEATNWHKNAAIKEQLWQDIEQVLALPNLEVRGLMTMAPYYAEAEACRPIFADLAALRDNLRADFEVDLPDLSMGMSNDYPVAIEEGATIVRVGRAIFGERL